MNITWIHDYLYIIDLEIRQAMDRYNAEVVH